MSKNLPPVEFPRKWSGYLSGAVKSAKILTHLSSKNALTSNSISRNNPTSSAGDFEWLTQHVISPRESKVSIFYWERPALPLIFRPNWGPKDQKTIFFLRPPPPPPSYLRVTNNVRFMFCTQRHACTMCWLLIQTTENFTKKDPFLNSTIKNLCQRGFIWVVKNFAARWKS